MSDLLPKSQAASVAKLSEKSIERAIAGGELAAVREHGRVLIERAELDRWMATRQARQAHRRRPTSLGSVLDYTRRTVAPETAT